MKRILFAGSLALAACGQALAADLPQSAPPPRAPAAYVPAILPTYNWGGVYIGINGGGGFGTSNWTNPGILGGTSGDFKTSGGLIGGTLGANFQANALVFGVEGDIDYSTIKGSSSSAFCVGINSTSCETRNRYLGTVRGRLGVAADRVLVFITGGAAFGDIQTGLTVPGTSTTYDTTNKVGWTGGGGIEVAFTDNLTGKIEYLYADLGSGTCSSNANCGFPAGDSVKFTTSVVRAGLNFKFGGGQ